MRKTHNVWPKRFPKGETQLQRLKLAKKITDTNVRPWGRFGPKETISEAVSTLIDLGLTKSEIQFLVKTYPEILNRSRDYILDIVEIAENLNFDWKARPRIFVISKETFKERSLFLKLWERVSKDDLFQKNKWRVYDRQKDWDRFVDKCYQEYFKT